MPLRLGPRKDMGSPFRTMTTEEKAIFQCHRFVLSTIFDGRPEGRPQLSADQIKKLADGRIIPVSRRKRRVWSMTSATWMRRSSGPRKMPGSPKPVS